MPVPSRPFDDLITAIDDIVKRRPAVIGASGLPVPFDVSISADGTAHGLPSESRRADESLGSHSQFITWRSLRIRWYFVGPPRLVAAQAGSLERALRGTQEEAPLGSRSLLNALTSRTEGTRPGNINAWFLPERRLAWTLSPAVADHLATLLVGRL